jgi:site-specific recombinase XerD
MCSGRCTAAALCGGAGLSGAAIAEVIKRRCAEAGLDPALFAGHSLRSGFLTSAAESGATVFAMMSVSRHRSLDTLSGYVRSAELFKNPAGQAFL